MHDRRPGDEALGRAVQRAVTGDEEAFAVLWRWLNPRLLRWLAVAAPGEAEDVASDVWLDVARGMPSFRGDASGFQAWTFTVARRRAIDAGRRRSRRAPSTSLDGVEPANEEDGYAAVLARQSMDEAYALLRALAPDQAEVVALRVIVGLNVAETAKVVDKSEGAVRALSHRGLRTLARRLQPRDDLESDPIVERVTSRPR